MTDIVFLKALREKLRGGNTRSIHLNALPGRFATRLDLAHLNYIRPDFAQTFLQQLFSNSCFEFRISFDGIDLNTITGEEQKRLGILSKRLNSLQIENEDNFREHGIKTFGFGFPLLVKPSRQDPTRYIKAPVFIWQMDIIKATNKVNTWSILLNKTRNLNGNIVDQDLHSVSLNDVLLSYLRTDENIVIPQIDGDILEDAIIDRTEIFNLCLKISEALNPDQTGTRESNLRERFNEPVKNLPEAAALEALAGKAPWIHFGGVFGLFRAQKESIIADMDQLIDGFGEFAFEKLVAEPFAGTALSAVETDPSQQEILTTLGIEPRKIIQGPPGTGKSQSLTALITNALANNQKCLVVCEKKTALDVIRNNLYRESDQLGGLAAVIDDINKDRDAIVNSVRDRLSNVSQAQSFNQAQYEGMVETVEQKAEQINQQHRLLAQRIYQGKSWTELVGEFLQLQRTADFTGLNPLLDHRQFRFREDEKELPAYLGKIRTARTLYAAVSRLDHPLERINDTAFEEDNFFVLKLRLETLTRQTSSQLQEVITALQQQLSAYRDWLHRHFLEHHQALQQQVQSFREFADANQQEYGDLFFRNDGGARFRIRFLSLFSGRYKKLQANRATLLKRLEEIRQTHQSLKYFDHSWIGSSHPQNLRDLVENMEKLGKRADEWLRNIEPVMAHYLETCSSGQLHPLHSGKEEWKETEKQYSDILVSLQQEKILNRTAAEATTHQQKVTEAESLLSELSIIGEAARDFREYFDWRKNYIRLSATEKQVILALIRTQCSNWEKTFQGWYYYWLLALAETGLSDLPVNSDRIAEYAAARAQLKKLQLNSIAGNWTLRQARSLKAAQARGLNPVSLYNKRGGKGEKRNSLRKIINSSFELFTDFFPVVMLSPSVCSSVIPLREGIFDLVIFDEASQLRIEDTFPALLRGRIKVVSGDSQQMPPSNFFQGGTSLLNPTDEDMEEELMATENEFFQRKSTHSIDLAESESLLAYAENCSYKPSYLKVHYRSKHPALIDFSNHAFYGRRLIPMPAGVDYKPIEFIQVNGLYKDQVNPDEARQVVDILLNHIQPFRNGTYPTVGVATFNLYQRNLILEEITKARQLNPEHDRKITDLGPDLFVKNLENIQGDERDIMILSTTFGRKEDGSFRQHFGPILQANGYRLLNVIITRARHKMYVCTSVPQEHFNAFTTLLNQMKNNGRAVFYAYLAYAKAVSENNHETRDALLQLLYSNSESKTHEGDPDLSGAESTFEQEVYHRLALEVGENRLERQYRIGGFSIDIAVKPLTKGQPMIAIECDGAKYHSSDEACAWDLFRQVQLEKQGLVFHRIWSANWWNSSAKELKKILDFISAHDQQASQGNAAPQE